MGEAVADGIIGLGGVIWKWTEAYAPPGPTVWRAEPVTRRSLI